MTPDAEGLALLKTLGLSDRLRDPKEGDDRTERFISFRHSELKADGTKADPIRIVEAKATENVPWDGRLIGNDSDVEVKFVKRDYGPGKKAGMYIRAIRVLKLVPYVAQDFAPLSEDDEFFAAQTEETPLAKLPEGMEPVLDNLDDDIPE